MRPSCYLNAVEIGGGNSLLYNGFSMCIDVVPSGIARCLASSVDEGDLSFLEPSEKEYLARRGHLTKLSVEGEREELGRLAHAIALRDSELNRQPLRGKMITFILTYRCNLACTYCFQNPVREMSPRSAMSEAFVEDFLRRPLGKIFPGTPPENLRFILFGGEPLLPGNRGTIERILRYAKDHGIVVSTATNALMLPRMLDLVGPGYGRIQNVQVTLDGEQVFHDETRVTSSGAPTFEKTIHALRRLIEAEAKAIVRVHLHPGRLESTRTLVKYLERENILGHDNVEIYFAPVHSFHAEDISSLDSGVFSRLFEYVALRQKKPPIQNFDFLERIMNVETVRNWVQPRYCAVSSGTHYAVDPLGDLYECLEEAGDREKRIGTVSGGEIEYFELREVYKGRYLANMPECLKCSIALICGGGCISRTRTQGGAVFDRFCRQNKVFVGETLKVCYLLNHAGRSGSATVPVCPG
ncbi:MAG: radical SAM protein [Desulfobacteraceae bacterium]|nr:radical SAM protein [Desulfobacteraceae bacterium]